MRRKTKAQLEREQKQEERERQKRENDHRKAEDRKRREQLRRERSRPRIKIPSAIPGESIYVHKRVYEAFMKRKDIQILSLKPVNGAGGKLVVEYAVPFRASGVLELCDLGPMPKG